MTALWMMVLLAATTTLVKSDCVNENGATYPDNSGPYPKGDGCNLCNCTNGQLECSQYSCGCKHWQYDITFAEGASYVTNEGCTRCTCINGDLDCTVEYCGCDVGKGTWVASGTSYQPDCNYCTCGNHYSACTLMGCPGCYTDAGYKEVGATWVSEDGCQSCKCVIPENSYFGGEAQCTPLDC